MLFSFILKLTKYSASIIFKYHIGHGKNRAYLVYGAYSLCHSIYSRFKLNFILVHVHVIRECNIKRGRFDGSIRFLHGI